MGDPMDSLSLSSPLLIRLLLLTFFFFGRSASLASAFSIAFGGSVASEVPVLNTVKVGGSFSFTPLVSPSWSPEWVTSFAFESASPS